MLEFSFVDDGQPKPKPIILDAPVLKIDGKSTREEIRAVCNEIEDALRADQIGVESVYCSDPATQKFEIVIEGDWKHDHGDADDLMYEKYHLNCVSSHIIGDDSMDDSYTAKHVYSQCYLAKGDTLDMFESTKRRVREYYYNDRKNHPEGGGECDCCGAHIEPGDGYEADFDSSYDIAYDAMYTALTGKKYRPTHSLYRFAEWLQMTEDELFDTAQDIIRNAFDDGSASADLLCHDCAVANIKKAAREWAEENYDIGPVKESTKRSGKKSLKEMWCALDMPGEEEKARQVDSVFGDLSDHQAQYDACVEIEKWLSENNFWYESVECEHPASDGFAIIIKGDWKHDHLRLDHQIWEKFHITCIGCDTIGGGESDYYQARHYFINPKKNDEDLASSMIQVTDLEDLGKKKESANCNKRNRHFKEGLLDKAQYVRDNADTESTVTITTDYYLEYTFENNFDGTWNCYSVNVEDAAHDYLGFENGVAYSLYDIQGEGGDIDNDDDETIQLSTDGFYVEFQREGNSEDPYEDDWDCIEVSYDEKKWEEGEEVTSEELLEVLRAIDDQKGEFGGWSHDCQYLEGVVHIDESAAKRRNKMDEAYSDEELDMDENEWLEKMKAERNAQIKARQDKRDAEEAAKKAAEEEKARLERGEYTEEEKKSNKRYNWSLLQKYVDAESQQDCMVDFVKRMAGDVSKYIHFDNPYGYQPWGYGESISLFPMSVSNVKAWSYDGEPVTGDEDYDGRPFEGDFDYCHSNLTYYPVYDEQSLNFDMTATAGHAEADMFHSGVRNVEGWKQYMVEGTKRLESVDEIHDLFDGDAELFACFQWKIYECLNTLIVAACLKATNRDIEKAKELFMSTPYASKCGHHGDFLFWEGSECLFSPEELEAGRSAPRD